MTDSEREKAIEALRARRAARGENDPLSRLSKHIENAILSGEKPIEGKSE